MRRALESAPEEGERTSVDGSATDICRRTGRRIHTLAVAGHGTPRTITLGDVESAGEEAVIDPGDFRDGESNANMEELFSRAAPGRRLYAPERATNTPGLKFDDETDEAVVAWDYRVA